MLVSLVLTGCAYVGMATVLGVAIEIRRLCVGEMF